MSEDEKTLEGVQKIYAVLDRWEAPMKEMLLQICEQIGYGRVLQITSEAWVEKDPIGAKLVGTCKGLTEHCGCETRPHCEWCCGSGWLTRHVKEIRDSNLQQRVKALEAKLAEMEGDNR